MERVKAGGVHGGQAPCISDGGDKNTTKLHLVRSVWTVQEAGTYVSVDKNHLEGAVIGTALLWRVIMCVCVCGGGDGGVVNGLTLQMKC